MHVAHAYVEGYFWGVFEFGAGVLVLASSNRDFAGFSFVTSFAPPRLSKSGAPTTQGLYSVQFLCFKEVLLLKTF